LAKLNILKQRRKIKTLQQRVKRLQKKLSTLSSLFQHLKKQNLISEAAHDTILVTNCVYYMCNVHCACIVDLGLHAANKLKKVIYNIMKIR